MFASKDQRIDELEKRMKQMEQSFISFRTVVEKMQGENAEIRRDRDFLMERYKDVLRRLEKPLLPLKAEINNTTSLVRDIMLEGVSEEKGLDDLFELVMKSGRIKTKKAAAALKLSEDRVRFLAERLKRQNLIDADSGLTELRKK
jgi:hypothetical protein